MEKEEKEPQKGDLLRNEKTGVVYLVITMEEKDGERKIVVTDGYYTWRIPLDHKLSSTDVGWVLCEANATKIVKENYRDETITLFGCK